MAQLDQIPAAVCYTPPRHIIRRDGERVAFDARRITRAIERAGIATKAFDANEAERLSELVCFILGRTGESERTIEEIQDVVEQTLIKEGYVDTARAYIRYRERRRAERADRAVAVDVGTSMDEYLGRADWRVNANANQGYSLGGLILNISGKVTANYWLSHVYPDEVGQAHREGDFYIHDLDMLAGYCAGWSLRTLLETGFNGVPGKVESSPPKHLSTALGQMVNFLGTLQNEWAGAQAFSSVDTYLAPFIKKDGLKYEQVRQDIQEFIYNLNVPSRWGTQTPFTNLTFDWTCPEDLRPQIPRIGGKDCEFTYGDLQAEMDMVNRAYIEVMTEGDKHGRVFTFPIPTYNVTKDFPWESENAKRLFAMTAKYGLPYFQNFINSDMDPGQVRSMCCRLQLDLRELQKRGNGLFGSAEQTGSIGVVTVNCGRLGYLYKNDEKGLIEKLDYLMDLARNSLEIKRKVIQAHIDNGLYPYTRHYLGSLRNHFSTIGVNGVNEMVRNFYRDAHDITSDKGKALAARVLDHIRSRMVEFQEETGHLYNLEATPAEGCTYRLAKEDRKRWPDILQAGTEDAPYYTNSSQLPVGYTDDPFEALDHQEELQTKYTGGTVLHLYMGERISSSEACAKLVKTVLTNYRLPYITVTPTFSICPEHGYLEGEVCECPQCGNATEVWTRVMGYHRPVQSFNKGKKSEHKDRTHFVEDRAAANVNMAEFVEAAE
ncbi:MAG: ribonucleoside triphosphate reductase [Alphaproteobacteria bacterium]|nr:ribonucleoside triphosphate reductase [Alphaproteobacteria bacterium]